MATTSSTVSPSLAPVRERGYESMKSMVWRRFRRHRFAVVGLSVMSLILFGVIFAPFVTPYDPNRGRIIYRVR